MSSDFSDAVRTALRDEYAEAFPNYSEDFTADEYVEANLPDVRRPAEEL